MNYSAFSLIQNFIPHINGSIKPYLKIEKMENAGWITARKI